MVDWSTPFGDVMPWSVVFILSRLDMDSKWKELASYLGMAIRKHSYCECTMVRHGSVEMDFDHF